jgi:hypothetical protein
MNKVREAQYKVLRKLGFKRTRRGYGQWPHEYERHGPDRVVRVQLWPNGAHRVSHDHLHDGDDKRRHCNTAPTEFETVIDMEFAIERESERTDGIEKCKKEQSNA